MIRFQPLTLSLACAAALLACGCVSHMETKIAESVTDAITPRAFLATYDIEIKGRTNRFAIFVPPGAIVRASADTPLPPLPCIVFLNGHGECGTDGLRQCLVGLIPAAMAKSQPVADGGWGDFIIIAPQKPEFEDSWEQHDDLVMASLERAKSLASLAGRQIDPTRIYLTGLSQGGAGTWAIGAKHADLFAAIAPVCGFVHTPGKNANSGSEADRKKIADTLAAAKMPVWAFHGEKDDVVRPEQSRLLVAAMAQAGWTADVRASYYPEANHNSWDHAYREDGAALAKWFLAHTRPQAPAH